MSTDGRAPGAAGNGASGARPDPIQAETLAGSIRWSAPSSTAADLVLPVPGQPLLPLAATDRDHVLQALLDQAPEAAVMAVGPDGLFVPMPASVPLRDHRVVQGHLSALEMVAPSDIVTVIDAWRQAVALGSSGIEITLISDPPITATLHFVDVTGRHGAVIGVLVRAPAGEGDGEQSELPGFRPRRCEVRKNSSAVLIAVDSAFARILGWAAEEVVGQRAIELVHPEDRERAVTNWIEMSAHAGSERRVRLRHRHRAGHWVWMEVTNKNRLSDPDHRDVVAEMVDISDEMSAQEALRASESLLRTLTEALPLGILHFGPDREIRYRNARVSRLLDRSRASTVDEQLAGVVPADRPAVEQALVAVLAGQDADVEVRLRQARRCHLRMRPIIDSNGQFDGALLSVADITEDARLRDELRQRATYDALTQCLNRAAILDELEVALAEPDRRAVGTAVIFFDVDHFKEINDKLGHGAGDQLLVAVARRLRAGARADDLVGRLGGDEFLVVCRKIGGSDQAIVVAERIAERLGEPLQLSHTVVHPKASIGVAWTAQEVDADLLVDRSDIAMYESKRGRLGRPVLYSG